MDDLDREMGDVRMAVELGPELRLAADQKHAHAILACGKDGAVYLGLGGPVRTHGVEGYDAGHLCGARRILRRRELRVPCSSRTSGRRGAASSFHDSWDTRRANGL